MDLNIFKDLKKDITNSDNVKKFMQEMEAFLKKERAPNRDELDNKINNNHEQKLQKNRKEGHLYLVTEDRKGEIYLWDFTEKSEHEFKEVVTSEELVSVAKEGAMLQYKNGKYELYSPNGYDMLDNEENKNK